jgi:hypothetical protein
MGVLVVDLIQSFLPLFRGLFACVVGKRIIDTANNFSQAGTIPTAICIETLLAIAVYFCPTDITTMIVMLAVLLCQWSACRRTKETQAGVNRLIYMHMGSVVVVVLQATASLWRPYY